MTILNDDIREQLRARFADRLPGDVDLTLHTRPGTGRLILPSGMGCPTCADAREMAEEVAALSGERIRLRVIDVTAEPGFREADVPTLTIAPAGQEARVRFQGLPGGFEFGAFIDALERVSSGDHSLRPETLVQLGLVVDPVEVLVFSTPG